MDDKIIVSNKSALLKKYGKTGTGAVTKALTALAKADKKRGLTSRTVWLDDAATMKKLGGKAVVNAADPRENKAAIDAVFKALTPDYLMILGAVDVVPQQDVTNAAYSAGGDDDKIAWGDLPYCCDGAYSRDPATFVGPTRVVGRLPDLVGAKKPDLLLQLIKTATTYTRRKPEDYAAYFGLSAKVWQGSTRMSLGNTFGNADKLLVAPPSGPAYPKGELKARSHFINCHGSPATPEFYGQQGGNYPVSLQTKTTQGQIVEGTVAAVECCYGAELYDSVTLGLDIPICQSYLSQAAYGYFGSTTIAYGPADDNGAADLVCQYFLKQVLAGASLGRAALLARQQFVQHAAQMDPIDLKTLAQFCLYGDPSIQPVEGQAVVGVPKSTDTTEAQRFFRAERRAAMKATGEFLTKTKQTASKRVRNARIGGPMATVLANIAMLAGLKSNQSYDVFAVDGAPKRAATIMKAQGSPSRYHVAVGNPAGKSADGVQRGVAVVAKEAGGRIVGYRIYQQR